MIDMWDDFGLLYAYFDNIKQSHSLAIIMRYAIGMQPHNPWNSNSFIQSTPSLVGPSTLNAKLSKFMLLSIACNLSVSGL